MSPDLQIVFALVIAGVVMLLSSWTVALLIAAKRSDERAIVITRQRFEALRQEAARKRSEVRR